LNHKELIVICGKESNQIATKTFDTLANVGIKHTYLIDKFNKILIDANYYAFRNRLDYILNETEARVKNGDNSQAVVIFDKFDIYCSVNGVDDIKEHLLKPFIEKMPVPVKLYVVADTYEMARNEKCLITLTGEEKVFVDYEDWRKLFIT
jgi:hypothetical protein